MLGLGLSDLCVRILDKGWLEKLGPQGMSELFGGEWARMNQQVQAGQYFQVVLICLAIGFSTFFLHFL